MASEPRDALPQNLLCGPAGLRCRRGARAASPGAFFDEPPPRTTPTPPIR
jgi:hypothetical protein